MHPLIDRLDPYSENLLQILVDHLTMPAKALLV